MHDENRTYRDKPEAPQPLPLAVVDNHTHLDISRDGAPTPDVRRTIDEAVAVGVDRMVQVGCDLDGARFTERVIDEHPELLGAVALHIALMTYGSPERHHLVRTEEIPGFWEVHAACAPN